jgi:HK97 family phage prohead protease
MSASNQWETRHIGFEGRAELSEDKRIRGYAIVFGVKSVDLGGFREIIRPSAVDRTLREGLDVLAYFDHKTSFVLGRTSAGTLRLQKDGHGLRAEISPPNTTMAKDLMVSIKRGDISGMSFRFRALDDEWHLEDGMPIREVADMVIGEVSIVSEPAYPDTEVAVRSLREFQATIIPPYQPSVEMLRRKMKLGGIR